MTREDFTIIIKQTGRRLYGYAYRLLENQQEAEDAVQETFLKLWKMKDKLETYESIEALSTTITRNYCIDQIRRRKSTGHEPQSSESSDPQLVPSPHELLERAESARIIGEIIDRLPVLQREIVRLRDIRGFSFEEISEKSGQSVNNIRVILSRARKFIREEYKKNRYED